MKIVKFLKIESVHENSKIKKLEKWKLEIIQFQITFDFWVFESKWYFWKQFDKIFFCWFGKFNEFSDESDFTFRQTTLFLSTVDFHISWS